MTEPTSTESDGADQGEESVDVEVAAILLAAGLSTRFGEASKQLARLDGESLLRRAARTVLQSPCRPVIAVIPPEPLAAPLRLELEGLAVTVTVNPTPEEGLASSVRRGLELLGELEHTEPQPSRTRRPELAKTPRPGRRSCTGAIFVPIDQPGLHPDLLSRLLYTHGRFPDAIVQPRVGNSPSSPTLFPRRLFSQLRALRGDEGGRQLIRDGEPLVAVEIENEEELSDLDTPQALEDYARRHRHEVETR